MDFPLIRLASLGTFSHSPLGGGDRQGRRQLTLSPAWERGLGAAEPGEGALFDPLLL